MNATQHLDKDQNEPILAIWRKLNEQDLSDDTPTDPQDDNATDTTE